MSIIQNEDRRDGEEWPDEDVHLATKLLEAGADEDFLSAMLNQYQ